MVATWQSQLARLRKIGTLGVVVCATEDDVLHRLGALPAHRTQCQQPKGNSYSIANHKAKMKFLNDKAIPNGKKSPYYWSAFVYYGNVVAPTVKDQTVYYILGILAFLIIVFLVIRKGKTNERKTRNQS